MKTVCYCIFSAILALMALGCGKTGIVYLRAVNINEEDIDADFTANYGGQAEDLVISDSGKTYIKVRKNKMVKMRATKTGFEPAEITKSYTFETTREVDEPIKLSHYLPKLEVNTELSKMTIAAGADEGCEVRVKIANSGSGEANNAKLKIRIPDGMGYEAYDPIPEEIDGSLVWELGKFKAAESREVSYRLRPYPNARSGERIVSVEFSGADIIGQEISKKDIKYFSIVGRAIIADLVYSAEPQKLDLPENGSLTYTIAFRNTGGSSTKEIEISMRLPEGFELEKYGLPPQVSFKGEEPGIYSLILPELAAGGSYELDIPVSVSSYTKKGTKISDIDLRSYDEANTPIRKSAQEIVEIIGEAQPAAISIEKTMREDADKTLKCEIKIANNGEGFARGLEIADGLPDGFSLAKGLELIKLEKGGEIHYELISNRSAGSGNRPEAFGLKFTENPTDIVWSIDKLEAGRKVSITYSLKAGSEDSDAFAGFKNRKNTLSFTAFDEWGVKIEPSPIEAKYISLGEVEGIKSREKKRWPPRTGL